MRIKPLQGIVVVALEQAVAAPYCSSRLADAGARVIKIERPEGDFARGYDSCVNGESSYFVWIGSGRERPCRGGRRARPRGRIGVSICDITAGMNALIGIQQALLQLARTGQGSGIKVSLFDSAAELMAVPYLQARYGGGAPERVGLKHPSIAPYGAFTCSDGREIVISIQNEREWASFCAAVLQQPELAADPRFNTNSQRTAKRDDLEARIQQVFDTLSYAQAADRLTQAQTAYGAINSVHELIQHPGTANARHGGARPHREDPGAAVHHGVGRGGVRAGAWSGGARPVAGGVVTSGAPHACDLR